MKREYSGRDLEINLFHVGMFVCNFITFFSHPDGKPNGAVPRYRRAACGYEAVAGAKPAGVLGNFGSSWLNLGKAKP